MNNLIKALLLTGAMISPALAQTNTTGAAGQNMKPGMMGAAMMGADSGKGMMNGGMMQQMAGMHQHMQQMQDLMARIRS